MGEKMDLCVPGYAGRHGFSVIPADTEELRNCAYRLRYYVYVAIMRRTQIYADHLRQIICEPMDEQGLSYLAVKDGQMIGTVRRNYLSDPATDYYGDFYQAGLFGMERARRIAMTTKLMVIPEYQGSRYSFQLITDYAEMSYRLGVEVDLIDCNDHLVQFFERFGYFSHLGWSVHKEYGRVRPMFLAPDAIRYLKRIRSPFASFAAKYAADGQYGGYELIRSLARRPALELARDASAEYRQRAYALSVAR